MIKTFEEAVNFLEEYIPSPDKKYPKELGLKRMVYFMEILGNPQLKYPTIHVGGTSGKGSTATIIASILATKYKVGLHTSPHLIKINERMKILEIAKNRVIKQEDISDQDFVLLTNQIFPAIKKLEKSKWGKPSYFEIITAMTFLYFYFQKVDIAVIEVGMGGKYDATNVVNPEVAVITNVGLDHMEVLGKTVKKIARNKAGIIKKGIAVVSGVRKASVIQIIKARSEKLGCHLSLLSSSLKKVLTTERDNIYPFSYQVKKIGSKGGVFNYQGMRFLRNLKIRLLGEHQIENAALALRAVEVLGNRFVQRKLFIDNPFANKFPLEKKFQFSSKDIRIGLKNAFIPGRFEIVKHQPLVILDGAHNPDKIKALLFSVKKIFPAKKVIAIVAIKNDKDAKRMLQDLLKISDTIIFTKFQLKGDIGFITGYDPCELLEIACHLNRQYGSITREILVIKDIKKALKKAEELAKKDDLILVTGSLYLVGEIKRILHEFY